MKKAIIILFLNLLIIMPVLSQSNNLIREWNLGLNLSGMTFLSPSDTKNPNLIKTTGIQAFSKQMFDKKYGTIIYAQYNPLRFDVNAVATNYLNVSAQGIFDLEDIFDIDKYFRRLSDPRYPLFANNSGLASNSGLNAPYRSLNLFAHAGFGWSALWQKDRFLDAESPFISQFDDMYNLGLGFLLNYKINRNWSLNLDLSYNFHIKQSRPFDFNRWNQNKGINGSYMGISAGVNYSLDKILLFPSF